MPQTPHVGGPGLVGPCQCAADDLLFPSAMDALQHSTLLPGEQQQQQQQQQQHQDRRQQVVDPKLQLPAGTATSDGGMIIQNVASLAATAAEREHQPLYGFNGASGGPAADASAADGVSRALPTSNIGSGSCSEGGLRYDGRSYWRHGGWAASGVPAGVHHTHGGTGWARRLAGRGLTAGEAAMVQRFDPTAPLDTPAFFIAKFIKSGVANRHEREAAEPHWHS